eukprot:148385-Chlamydomonas_euryale.AAC.2
MILESYRDVHGTCNDMRRHDMEDELGGKSDGGMARKMASEARQQGGLKGKTQRHETEDELRGTARRRAGVCLDVHTRKLLVMPTDIASTPSNPSPGQLIGSCSPGAWEASRLTPP